ncbi:helix-turn-helix transcriptional regulator [Amycolatopsis nigrescens]|uniref:helix-turn-helix transcriptional regulator n=1 Tax=Amycolatopsis nigrescens TaxID=381445 RepID=UPI000371BB8C|nr:LuxR family transcriptional regulator [Amycolatopsis nigrescens]
MGRRDEFLALVRAKLAESSVLVYGPEGIGKSTVLADVLAAGTGAATVLSSRPDRRIPYLVLADLLAGPLAERVAELPVPQRNAVEQAVCRRTGTAAPDGLALRLGVLSLLRAAAPVLLVLDDAQWLDGQTARLLSFAVTRLPPPGLRLLAAERVTEPDQPRRARWCAHALEVPPLPDAEITELVVANAGSTPYSAAVLNAVRLAGGNPLFAAELGNSLRGLIGAQAIPPRLCRLLDARLRPLPSSTRAVLLVAALAAAPDLNLLVHFGQCESGWLAGPAARRVVRTTGSGAVRFRHPLLAARLLATAEPARLREIHAWLSTRVTDPAERARHRAEAVPGRDERVAAMLVRAAATARRRGSPGQAAELGVLAADRTPPEAVATATARRLRAAGDALGAGRPELAISLAHNVLCAPRLPRNQQVLARLVIVDAARNARTAAGGMMTEALVQASGDVALEGAARYRFAVHAALGGDFRQAAAELADSAVLARAAGDPHTEVSALCSLALCQIALGDRTATATLELARAHAPPDLLVSHDGPAWVSARLALFADRLRPAEELLTMLLDRAAESGARAELIGMTWAAVEVQLAKGECAGALRRATECLRLAEQTGSDLALACYGAALAEAFGGDPVKAAALARRGAAVAEQDGDNAFLLRNLHAQGLAALSSGEQPMAVAPLRRAVLLEDGMGVTDPAVFGVRADLAESLVAAGQLAEAAALIGGARANATRLGRRGVLGTLYRADGLLQLALRRHGSAECALHTAVELHHGLAQPLQHGRSLLALGIAERRRKRRGASRAALRLARDVFTGCGAPGWAARASVLLGAPTAGDPAGALTGWESRIAGLVAAGASNQEVARRLDISVKTVEGALTRIYRKLGVRTRTQLSARLRG